MGKICAIKTCPSGRSVKTQEMKNKKPHSLSYFKAGNSTRLQHWTQSLDIPLKMSDHICQLHFKDEHIKKYDVIKIGEVTHYSYLERKVLLNEALPKIEHQSKIQDEPPPQQHKQIISHVKEELQQAQACIEQPISDQVQQEFTQCLDVIFNGIKSFMLPENWLFRRNSEGINFFRIDPVQMQKLNQIRLNNDKSVTIICSNKVEVNTVEKITSTNGIAEYLNRVERWPLCVGTQMEPRRYSKECRGVIFGEDSYKRQLMNPRCMSCRILRKQLQNIKTIDCGKLEETMARKRRVKNIKRQCK